jgi:hypothetical protein
VIFLKFDGDYRPCWSIHIVTNPLHSALFF